MVKKELIENKSIFFLETYTNIKIPYKIIHRKNPTRWRDLPSNFILGFDGEREGELYDFYKELTTLLWVHQD